MSETKNQNKLLDIYEIEQINQLSDFLKQKPFEFKYDGDSNIDQEEDEFEVKNNDVYYSDINEYICLNSQCQYLQKKTQIEYLHIYEVNADQIITICDHCHNQGYRFCLFSHIVMHITKMFPVLDGMYVHSSIHKDKLDPVILNKLDNLDEYFQMIGIDNPNPNYHIIDVKEEACLNED